QDIFPGDFVSYKLDCQPFPPLLAKVVCFHGKPKPHECEDWVTDVWNEKDVAGVFLESVMNVSKDVARDNKLRSLGRGTRLKSQEPREGDIMIVGGGPSVVSLLPLIEHYSRMGWQLWAINAVGRWLANADIWPDATVIVDARPENAAFINQYNTTYYLADH